ncbi:hypothetical protein NMY22_g3866 [Coprinellus aureogranulatus]|nr:hypothetical protein NMY22_g3866 [Coprinellus aureogranulatus]
MDDTRCSSVGASSSLPSVRISHPPVLSLKVDYPTPSVTGFAIDIDVTTALMIVNAAWRELCAAQHSPEVVPLSSTASVETLSSRYIHGIVVLKVEESVHRVPRDLLGGDSLSDVLVSHLLGTRRPQRGMDLRVEAYRLIWWAMDIFEDDEATWINVVEEAIHHVPLDLLEPRSQTFKEMFFPPNAEWTSESKPIVVSGCADFEFTSLLDVLSGPRSYSRRMKRLGSNILLLTRGSSSYRYLYRRARLMAGHGVESAFSNRWKPIGLPSTHTFLPQPSMASSIDERVHECSRGWLYKPEDLVYLKVEDAVFCLPRPRLQELSQVFRDLFSLPQGPDAEGRSYDAPIIIPDCKKKEFEAFVKLLLAPMIVKLGTVSFGRDDWVSILRLATMWDMPEVKTEAIYRLEHGYPSLTPEDKVLLGQRYGVSRWSFDGYCFYATGAYESVDWLGAKFGWETAARIAHAACLATEAAKGKPLELPIQEVKPSCLERQPRSFETQFGSHPVQINPTVGKRVGVRRNNIDLTLRLEWVPGVKGQPAWWAAPADRIQLEKPRGEASLTDQGYEIDLTGPIEKVAICAYEIEKFCHLLPPEARASIFRLPFHLIAYKDVGVRARRPLCDCVTRLDLSSSLLPGIDHIAPYRLHQGVWRTATISAHDMASPSLVLKAEGLLYHVPAEREGDWAHVLHGIAPICSGAAGHDIPMDGGPSVRVLSDCKPEDFESLKAFVEGSRLSPLTDEQWISILRLATAWTHQELRSIAIERLSKRLTNPLDLLRFGLQYKIKAWILEGCSRLTQPGKYVGIQEMGEAIGWKSAARVAEISRLTSELSKHEPVVIPRTTLVCSACGHLSYTTEKTPQNRLVYSVYPTKVGNEEVAFDSTVVTGLKPFEDSRWGREKGWSCGQCESWYSYPASFQESPVETLPLRIVLSDLLPGGYTDNHDIILHAFAEELSDAY